MNEDKVMEGIYDIQKRLGHLENGQHEIKQKLTDIEGNIDLLAQKQWNNEKDIYNMKRTLK